MHVAVQSGGTGVDEVHDAVLGQTFHGVAGHALHSGGAPVGADVGEAGSATRQLVQQKHAHAVHGIVFRGEGNSLTRAVPVEGAVEEGFGHIAVRVEVRPVTLSLETAANGIEAHAFFLAVDFLELGIAMHHIAEDDGHEDRLAQGAFLLLGGEDEVGAVAVRANLHELLGPFHGKLELSLVVDAQFHAAAHFGHVDSLHAHAHVAFPEGLVNNGTCDTHGAATDGEVALATQGGHGETSAGKAQNLLSHVLGDGGIIGVLHVVTVDGESRNPLLGITSQSSGQVHSAGALGAIEAPDSLGGGGIGLKSFGDVAPAGSHNQGAAHVVLSELLVTGSSLSRTTDGGVGDDALHGLAVGVGHVSLDEGGGSLGHVHGLILQGFTNAEAAAVNRGADTNGR